MKKHIVSSFLVISMIGGLFAGCGQEAETKKSIKLQSLEETKKEDGIVSLTLWGAKEDAKLLQETIDSFKKEYEGQAQFDITIEAVGEADCRKKALSNVSECADVFTFADDQLQALAASGVLRPVENPDKIISASLEGSVSAASINDTLYAYPLTADNGYFMFYNKKYFSDSDLESLEDMIDKASTQEKYVTMDWNSGWYLYSFFANTGLTVGLNDDGISNYCTWNDDSGKIKGVDVAESLLAIANSNGFQFGDDEAFATGAENGSVIAGVSGVWLADRLQDAWGEDYAATKLPTYSVGGQNVQMGSYTGYKLVGVNSYSKEHAWATKLAEWMVSKENQLLRFEKRGQGPANATAADTEEVKENVAIKALLEQSEFGSLQRIGGHYWTPVAEFGSQMATGEKGSNLSLQEMMDHLVEKITATE